MIPDTVWIALIASIGTIVGVSVPVLMKVLSDRGIREDKLLEWDRQDKIAKGARDDAAEAARLLLAANERVAANTKATNGKLDVIHTLVNSKLTTVTKVLYETTQTLLNVLRDPSLGTSAVMEETVKKLAELKVELEDRKEQQTIIDAQVTGDKK